VACLSPPIETVKPRVIQQTPIRVPQNNLRQADILFLVDNSPSMDAMQAELKQKFGKFFDVFRTQAEMGNFADLNIGVVTSDFGAGMQQNQQVTKDGVVTGCGPAPGDNGILRTTAAPHQSNSGCAGPVGAPFIHYVFGPKGDTSNLPSGTQLADTFTCIASVGANGCGFEHQLESVYAALTNTKENAGFVRDGALLAVVFVTNEDDGSAPRTTHIFDKAGGDTFGIYDTYRQTRYGVACGDPLALPPYGVANPLSGCVAAEDDDKVQLGQEFDVSRYTTLLLSDKAHHGIKDDPLHNVVLVGIDAPETPFSVVAVDSNSGSGNTLNGASPTYQPCAMGQQPDALNSCRYRLQHSCQNRAAPGFFGDPPVRLNQVIKSAKFFQITNICGDDLDVTPDYSSALADVAKLINTVIGPGCIPAPLTDLQHPDCTVEDVTSDGNGNVVHEQQLSQCALDSSGAPLPTSTFPCWAVLPKADCKMTSPEGVGVTIFRNNVEPPANTNARVECSTIASTPS
jgi:hypothetical protein